MRKASSHRRTAAVAAVLAFALAATACVREPQPAADLGQGQPPSAAAAASPTPTVTPAPPTPEPTQPPQPAVNLAKLRATAPFVPEPWPWGVDPSPQRGHRVCADAAPLPTTNQATFARTDGSASLTPDVISVICAASPRASLKIAMYYIENNGQDVQRILDALSFVAKRRDVAVRVVEDRRRRDMSYDFAATADQLRQFAAVHNCLDGCRSGLPPRGEEGGSPQVEVQHDKFIVLSDTYASPRVAPAVWTASANWSDKQLHTRSQSGLIVRDPGLANVFSLRFDSMEMCAKRGCGAWNQVVRKRGLEVQTYGVARVGGIWFDRAEGFWAGTRRSGSFVQFSPWLRRDPVAAQLSGIRCTKSHDKVWVAQRVIARSRGAVTSALAALDDQGCDVRIIVSSSSMKVVAVFADGYQHLRELGLDASCVKGVHDKFLLIKAIDAKTGQPFRSLTAGSQGLMRRALRFSDEALVTLTTANTTKKARAANKAVWHAYKDHFEHLAAQVHACP